MDKTDLYARLPASMEIVEGHRGPIVKPIGEIVEISDTDRCFICAAPLGEIFLKCERCGFTYCQEHAGGEYHKCVLPKHWNDTPKELKMLALDMRRLMGAEFQYESEQKVK